MIDFTNHHVFVINVSLQWGVGTPCVPLMRDITYCGEKTPPKEISNGRRRDIFISSGPQGLNASQNQYVLSADAQNESPQCRTLTTNTRPAPHTIQVVLEKIMKH